ncbi:MAG: hypothetical protein U0230_24115 [Polyangiales bacterium]
MPETVLEAYGQELDSVRPHGSSGYGTPIELEGLLEGTGSAWAST